MIKILRRYLGSLLVLFFAGCSASGLLPEDFTSDAASAQQGKVILLSSMQRRDPHDYWAQFKVIKIVATDMWQSRVMRLLTPIVEDSQQVQFAFDLRDEDAVGRFLSGRQMGNIIGLAGDRTYFVNKGVKTQEASQKVLQYLSLTRNYFLWPQVMHGYKNIAYLGQVRLEYMLYYKVFVSDAGWDSNVAGDQYIVWVNCQSLNIDYIEFNLRDSTSSHHGVVQYRDYREVDGVSLAHTVILSGKIEKQSPYHKFYVEVYSLD